ncbi:MAG TPA: glycosyltransferase family 2 protein [Candidatus Saccharimonadales bacterium]|nr:glycosyltransferase family 2 protein [Candidatus Saccharimonadales bacterium]
MSKKPVCVVIPNWNGEDYIVDCLNSLRAQTVARHVIVVDNGSRDGSVQVIERQFPEVKLIINDRNLGFAEGVNIGIRAAIQANYKYVALLNNDAVAHPDWLKNLLDFMEKHDEFAIATPKLLDVGGKTIDGTGEVYTIWGIHYPRGRGEKDLAAYDNQREVFGASGGASIYRLAALKQIGLFDKDFFAYYEDIDLSFRAQLAGWKVAFVPAAEVYHHISASSSRIKGFATYQTLKNLPFVVIKNVPGKLLFRVLPRFWLVYGLFFVSAFQRRQGRFAIKGLVMTMLFFPKKLFERYRIQHRRVVPVGYIASIIEDDLPPTAVRLRSLRSKWRKLWGRP